MPRVHSSLYHLYSAREVQKHVPYGTSKALLYHVHLSVYHVQSARCTTDRTEGIEDYQGSTKALQPVKLPEAAAQTECGAVKHPADAH